ncbi:hypothetical protein OAN21_02030 [Alphaproteobacteria bacterium]|nr:hypothetical protein [Alphaproteobacteria bacterium]
MTFKYFFSTLFFSSLIAFTPHATLEEAGPAARRSPTALVQPIVTSHAKPSRRSLCLC